METHDRAGSDAPNRCRYSLLPIPCSRFATLRIAQNLTEILASQAIDNLAIVCKMRIVEHR
jgi:hypothetical protein